MTVPADAGTEMPATTTTTGYTVVGMTCAHCVAAVTEEITALAGVTAVEVELVVGGGSRVTVTAAAPPAAGAVRGAVREAGYDLAAADR